MFAVIVPTYQKRSSLRELFVSLKKQTFKNFSVIIVNNNSDGDSIEFLESIIGEFPELNIYLLNPGKNLGAGGGRNYGGLSKHAQNCQYYAFIDDDCEALPEWLGVANNFFNGNPEAKVIYGTVVSDLKPYPPFIHGFDMQGGVFGSGNCVIEKEFFLKIKGFDTYLNNWAEDFEFGERCKVHNETPCYVKDLIVNHPPKLVNYSIFSHILKPSFYKKYLYLVRIKNYEYKSSFRRDHFKRGLARAFLFLPLFYLIKFNFLFVMAPFLFHALIFSRKLPQIFKQLKSYPFENDLNFLGLFNYLHFHWLADVVNLVLLIFYRVPFVEDYLVSKIEKEISG